MPTVQFAADIKQGFDFKKDVNTTVAFLKSLKVGDTTVTADLTVKNPTAPTDDLKVVAVLSHVMWEAGPTDSIYLSGQISTVNMQSLGLLVLHDLTKVEVTFQFQVYDYDPVAKAYYLAFHVNDTDMAGLLEKRGKDLNLAVSREHSHEVQSPMNHSFQIGIKAQAKAQTLNVATSTTQKIVLAWGITQG